MEERHQLLKQMHVKEKNADLQTKMDEVILERKLSKIPDEEAQV